MDASNPGTFSATGSSTTVSLLLRRIASHKGMKDIVETYGTSSRTVAPVGGRQYAQYKFQRLITLIKDTFHRSKKREQPYISSFPFLRLPAEVRNRIYELYLTNPNGAFIVEDLSTKKPKFIAYRTIEEGLELNQMKYVCHQLYRETRGIAIKYNELVFMNARYKADPGVMYDGAMWVPNDAPSILCSRFLNSCAAKWQNDTIQIRIWEHRGANHPHGQIFIGFDPLGVRDLAQFCRLHPKTLITFHLPQFRAYQHLATWLVEGSILQLAVRKRFPSIGHASHQLYPFCLTVISSLEQAWRGYGVNANPVPKNLHFVTWDLWRPDAWEMDQLHGYQMYHFVLPQIRNWYKDGF